jgi:hypothetical protein
VTQHGCDRHQAMPPLLFTIYPQPPILPGRCFFIHLASPVMTLSTLLVGALLVSQASAIPGRNNPAILKRACPDYTSYASTPQYVPHL